MSRNILLTASLSVLMALSTVNTLSARAFSSRTGVLNPQIARTSVGSGQTDSYTIAFKGGETGRVEVNGDGSTMLDLSVYDENGNLVLHQAGYRPWVTFLPYWTQNFTIRVYNRGAVVNDYVLRTN